MAEPEHVLAISMAALLLLGLCSQMMRAKGGAVARHAPIVTLALLLVISVGGMLWLQQTLMNSPDWREDPGET